jgi:hypothetical protein
MDNITWTYHPVLIVVREDVNDSIQSLKADPTAIITTNQQSNVSPSWLTRDQTLESVVEPLHRSYSSIEKLAWCGGSEQLARRDLLCVLQAVGIAQDTRMCPRWLFGHQHPLEAVPKAPF